MSVDYSAKIVIAVPYKEIKELFDNSDSGSLEFYEWVEDNGLIQFPPFYDAPPSESLYGCDVVGTDDYSNYKIDMKDLNYFNENILSLLKNEFPDLDWKTYLTTIGV